MPTVDTVVDWDVTVQMPIDKTAAAPINANEASITELISIIALTSLPYVFPNPGRPGRPRSGDLHFNGLRLRLLRLRHVKG